MGRRDVLRSWVPTSEPPGGLTPPCRRHWGGPPDGQGSLLGAAGLRVATTHVWLLTNTLLPACEKGGLGEEHAQVGFLRFLESGLLSET